MREAGYDFRSCVELNRFLSQRYYCWVEQDVLKSALSSFPLFFFPCLTGLPANSGDVHLDHAGILLQPEILGTVVTGAVFPDRTTSEQYQRRHDVDSVSYRRLFLAGYMS